MVNTSGRYVSVCLGVLSKQKMIYGMLLRYIREDTMIIAQYSVIKESYRRFRAGFLLHYCSNTLRNIDVVSVS